MATTRKTSTKKKPDGPDTLKMYVAIRPFYDLKDNRYFYAAGDCYPREGLKVSEDRITELISDKNMHGYPFIEEQ